MTEPYSTEERNDSPSNADKNIYCVLKEDEFASHLAGTPLVANYSKNQHGIQLLNNLTGKILNTFDFDCNHINQLGFSEDGQQLVAVSDNTQASKNNTACKVLKVWDIQSFKEISTISFYNNGNTIEWLVYS